MLTREALHADIRDRVFRLAERPEGERRDGAAVSAADVGEAGARGEAGSRGEARRRGQAGTPAPGGIASPGALDDPGHISPLEEPFPRVDPPPPPPRRIGAEVEWIPVSDATGRAQRIEGEGGSLGWVREHARRHDWREDGAAAVPRFVARDGGVLFFEPGGQLEYASSPHAGPAALLATLREVSASLEASARAAGVALLARGLDPRTPLAEVPLQLCTPRYVRMDRYLAGRGEAGAVMMRQTASCQVNLDFPAEPLLAWRVLNAAAPLLTAIFATSPLREGRPTGFVSARAAAWLALDPARTGVFHAPLDPDAAAAEYLAFALAAPFFLEEPGAGRWPAFGERLEEADEVAWRAHLTTLFPEVRPRGYLEVRSIDALPAPLYPAPIILLTGLLHHRPTLHEAVERLGEPDPRLLPIAARAGLADARIAAGARVLVTLGLAGARALGGDVVPDDALEAAARFFETRTLRGRPALEAEGAPA